MDYHKGMQLLRVRYAVILALTLTSAALLAEMPLTPETAERIATSRIAELKREDIAQMKTGSVVELYSSSGEKTAQPENASYTLKYVISPLLQEKPPLREITLQVEWKPEANVNLTQRFKLSSYLAPDDSPKK